jgi:hypothetical protein
MSSETQIGRTEDSVAALGVWQDSIITAKGGMLAGTRLQILTGCLAPRGGSEPERGPYAGEYRWSPVDNATNLLESGIIATVLNVGGTNAGLVLGSDVAIDNLKSDNVGSGAFNTALWFHDPIILGPAFIMDDMAQVDRHEVTGARPRVFSWGAVIPPTTNDVDAHVYASHVLALCGQRTPVVSSVAQILSLLPLDKVIEILARAVKARPRSLRLPGNIDIDIDQFHAIAATHIIFSGGCWSELPCGSARYALAVGTAIADHLSPIPAPFAALRIMADKFWIPPPQTIAQCIQFMAEIAGERTQHFESTPLIESMCAEANMGRRPILYIPVPTKETTLSLTDLIFEEVAYFQTDSAESEPYLNYVKKLREARAPWLVTPDYYDMKDFRRSQERQWVEFMTPREGPPETIVDGIQKITYALTPGWIASMIGTTKIAIGDETVLVSPNLTKLNGPPLVIRTPGPDQDDLSENTKDKARQLFLRLFSSEGFPLRYVPHSLREFNGITVKLDGDTIIFADPAGGLHRFTDTLDIQRNCCQHAQMPPFEKGVDWQDMRCWGGGVRLGAEREIANLIKPFTVREMLRAVTLMRNFNNRIEFTTRPTLYPEDRAVYRLMCAVAYLYPVAVKREGLVFNITDGPVFWSIIDKHLVMTQPAHYAWNAPISIQIDEIRPSNIIGHNESGGRGSIRLPEMERELIGQLVKKYGATEAIPVIFNQSCSNCDTNPPTIKNAACGHVALCARCLANNGTCPCPICAAEGDYVDVGLAPHFDVTHDGRLSLTRIPTDLFSWQRQALDRLISFAAPTEVIWLPPGAGKTLIIIKYIRWCLANKRMTKYLLWSTVPVAIPNLQLQCARAGISTRMVPRNGELEPGIINIVKNSDLYTITDAATRVGPNLTYIPDEFHTCVSKGTMRARACINICKNSARNIPISGTVFKNSNSPGELVTFLSLCVRFQISPENYLVAVGLMISFRVPSRSVIRRTHKEIHLLQGEDDNRAMERAMISDAIKSVSEEEVGAIICVESLGRAQLVVEDLTRQGIRAVSQTSQRPLNYGPQSFPDPRGPGLVASGAIVGGDASEDDPTGPNPSLRLPQVIVIPIKDGFVTGYDMNRYRLMLIAVVPSNEATREQLAGRIDRANNNSRFIQYVTYYTPGRKAMHDRHETDRAMAEALRDSQEGDDSTRRTYDPEERKRRIHEAEAAREKARARTEHTRPADGPSDRLAPIYKACILLGIEYVAVGPALRILSAKARRNLALRWHPDKWAAGTEEEKAYAVQYSKEINNAYDVILQHTA